MGFRLFNTFLKQKIIDQSEINEILFQVKDIKTKEKPPTQGASKMAYAGSVDSDNSDPNYITPKIDGTKQTDVSYRHHKYFFRKILRGIIYTLGYIE